MSLRATLIRLSAADLAVLCDAPSRLAEVDRTPGPRVLDLGRAWEELGCLLDGGFSAPTAGPTVGELALSPLREDEGWSYVLPPSVARMARELSAVGPDEFLRLYRVGDEETADCLPDERTGPHADGATYLFERLARLRDHYAAAAAAGEAMLVHLGP